MMMNVKLARRTWRVLVVPVISLLAIASFARATHVFAGGIGPTINATCGAGPGGSADPHCATIVGNTIDVTFTTTTTSTNAYAGYQIVVDYDSLLVTPPSFTDNSVPGLWATDLCLPLPPIILTGSMRAAGLGCASLAGGVTIPGPLATASFQGLATGVAVIHMETVGLPDNGGVVLGTYTLDPGTGSDQSNALTCTGSCNSQPWDVDITIVPVPNGPSVGGLTDLEIHGSGALPAFADAQGSASERPDLGFAATVLALAIVGTATVVLARRRWVR